MLQRFYAHKPSPYNLANRPEPEYERYARLVASQAGNKGRILDFGCGTIRSLHTLSAQGFSEVVGCDYFPEREDFSAVAASAQPNVQLVHLSGSTLPFPDAHFDCVASLCVLEHVIDIEAALAELHRVLKPGGSFVIVGPNWSGLNNPIRALYVQLKTGKRYWHFENIADSLLGIVRVFAWYAQVQLADRPEFLLIYPRMRDGEIWFEASDDDCVHLSHPLSYKRWFLQRNYAIRKYNRGEGNSRFARLFNSLLPSLSTTNVIVAVKRGAARDHFGGSKA